MKKYLILALLLIPINIKAEIYYTEYQPYLLNQKERLEINDLFKETKETKYYYEEEVKYNEGYHSCNQIYIDKPYKDEKNTILYRRDESLKNNPGYTRAMLFATEDFIVKDFKYLVLDFIPETFLFNTNLERLNYTIRDNKIILEKEISVLDLIIYLDGSNTSYGVIEFNNGQKFQLGTVIFNNPYVEVNFASFENMMPRVKSLGVYTTSICSEFSYHVKHIYHCLFYDIKKEIKTTNEEVDNYIKKENIYNYQKRDYIDLKDYLIVTKKENNIKNIINSTSINEDDLTIDVKFDVNTNGVYEATISYKEIEKKRPIIVLNDIEIKETNCPKEKIKYIDRNIIIEKEKPVYIEKEKPIYIEKECNPIIKEKIVEKPIEVVKKCEAKAVTKTSEKPKKDIRIISDVEKEVNNKTSQLSGSPLKNIEYKKANKSNDSKFNYGYLLPVIPVVLIIYRKLKRNS